MAIVQSKAFGRVSAWVSVVITFGGGALGAIACGEEEDGGDACAKALSHLRECGVYSEGDVPDSGGECDANAECFANCMASLGCEEARTAVCTPLAPPPAYQMCLMNCASAGQITCADGMTMATNCNGIPECPDMSDEAMCMGLSCDGGMTPLFETDRCDGFMDCTDGTDEANCPMFACADGTMVAGSARCNSIPQCPDMSDETGCAMLQCTPMGSGTMTAPSAT